MIASLRPEEPEDVIVNACLKLIAFFNQRSEQKVVFVKQHGLLPLMELLEVPRPRVCNFSIFHLVVVLAPISHRNNIHQLGGTCNICT